MLLTGALVNSFNVRFFLARAERRLAREDLVNRGFRTLFAIGTGDPHRADHFVVQHDRQRAVLWKIVHECRRQIL